MLANIIEIDGQDKTGKDVLHRYIEQLSNYKYIINSRGILTQLVYSDKFKRNYKYSLSYVPFIVLLTADDCDLEIRCRISNEPKCNFTKDREAFKFYADKLRSEGITVLEFNTSNMTMINIAKEVIKFYEHTNDNALAESKLPLKLESYDFYSSEDIKDEDVFYGGLVNG